MKFEYQTPTLDTSWRSIILLGQNTASYKFALAKTLLELNIDNDLVLLEDLALPYARNIAQHLAIEDKQATSATSTENEEQKTSHENEQRATENEQRKRAT